MATYVSDLDPSQPAWESTAKQSEIRELKQVLLNTFPNIDEALLASELDNRLWVTTEEDLMEQMHIKHVAHFFEPVEESGWTRLLGSADSTAIQYSWPTGTVSTHSRSRHHGHHIGFTGISLAHLPKHRHYMCCDSGVGTPEQGDLYAVGTSRVASNWTDAFYNATDTSDIELAYGERYEEPTVALSSGSSRVLETYHKHSLHLSAYDYTALASDGNSFASKGVTDANNAEPATFRLGSLLGRF